MFNATRHVNAIRHINIPGIINSGTSRIPTIKSRIPTICRMVASAQISRKLSTQHPGIDGNTSLPNFPPRKFNTILHFGKQGHQYVVEQFGKLQRIESPGIFVTMPFIHKIYEVDTRQLVIDVSRQRAYTSDNVAISVAAQLYLTIVDVEKSCYKVRQPLVAVMSQAQSALRTTIGKHDLDHLLADRNIINKVVSEALVSSTEQWGISVERFEITDLAPDDAIQAAMDLQSTAERERRAVVITAEGKKQSMELEAAGKRRSMELDAEGKKLAAELIALGFKNASITMSGIPGKLLDYNVFMAHIKMVGELASKGHSTYFIPKDISTLPAVASMFNEVKQPIINKPVIRTPDL